MPAVREELQRLLEVELLGSSSINTRTGQLAALSGATIALAANFASDWADMQEGTLWALQALFILSMVLLLDAAWLALGAVRARSLWRDELKDLLGGPKGLGGEDPNAGGEDPAESADRVVSRRLLCMVEKQRCTNTLKAKRLNWAYSLFFVAIIGVAAQAVIVVWCGGQP